MIKVGESIGLALDLFDFIIDAFPDTATSTIQKIIANRI